MELKVRNLVKAIVSIADKARVKRTIGLNAGEEQVKKVVIHLPLEVIEELRAWSEAEEKGEL